MIDIIRKAFFKLVKLNQVVDRAVRYRNPRKYWCERGGDPYFAEQEAVQHRALRSQFIVDEIRKLEYDSLLEIGCGYGKQLKNLKRLSSTFIAGIDFSRSQLLKAREVCFDVSPCLVEADAESLPFKDKTFDVVLSSAVILHNDYEKARRILSEMIRVSRKYLIHNEDTDITFSRYGYDMKKTYEKMGFRLVEWREIPFSPEPSKTQFTVVEITATKRTIEPEAIPLEYH